MTKQSSQSNDNCTCEYVQNNTLCPTQWYDNMNFLHYVLKVNESFSAFKKIVFDVLLSVNILVNIDLHVERHFDYNISQMRQLFFKCNCLIFRIEL